MPWSEELLCAWAARRLHLGCLCLALLGPADSASFLQPCFGTLRQLPRVAPRYLLHHLYQDHAASTSWPYMPPSQLHQPSIHPLLFLLLFRLEPQDGTICGFKCICPLSLVTIPIHLGAMSGECSECSHQVEKPIFIAGSTLAGSTRVICILFVSYWIMAFNWNFVLKIGGKQKKISSWCAFNNSFSLLFIKSTCSDGGRSSVSKRFSMPPILTFCAQIL